MDTRRDIWIGLGAAAAVWLSLAVIVLAQEAGEQADPAVVVDDATAFRAVTDRAPLKFVENLAYGRLLARTRESTPGGIEQEARRDLVFADFLNRPATLRGAAVRLQGTVRRVTTLEDLPEALTPKRTLYEFWTFTSDSQGYPYLLVSETLPTGMKVGDNVSEFVTFEGYFFKLLAYRAGDKNRVAPMLVGRVDWKPELQGAAPDLPAQGEGSLNWSVWLPMAAFGALLLYTVVRVVLMGRRLARSERAAFPWTQDDPTGRRVPPPVNDTISKEDLDAWVQRTREEPDEAE